MNLHTNILYLTFLTIYFHKSTSTRNRNLVLIKSGIENISPCSVGLQFVSTINNTSDEDYFVELLADECCIDSGDNLDCESLEILGDSSDVIEKGEKKTFKLIAPIIDPFERKGYCVIHLDSRPIDKRNDIMRDNIRIDFDTEIKKEDITAATEETIKKCKNIDEDPFNDCKPVNCDTHYNGKKPIYDKTTKRCIKAPKFKAKNADVNRVYDPLTNRCIDGDPIDNEDIDFIKSLSKDRQPKDVIIIEANIPLTNTTEMTTLTGRNKAAAVEVQRRICGNILKYLTANKYTLLVLGMVIFVQCCLICTMIYCLTKRSMCCDKKKVERKYYNYRQDVSVTTPLIGTSNIDTETTGFDYVSESSNIDKKIKCYKACQKERKNDPKISMSDDILSKCLNRRDWNVKPKTETNSDVNNVYYDTNIDWNNKKCNIQDATKLPASETKENEEKQLNIETEDYRTRKVKEDYDDSDSSEKIIRSHDYSSNSRKVCNSENAVARVAASISTGKGAQACFSNDSVDDFLSERGIIYLAGEAMSKYSFPTNSTPTSSIDMSCKTSKNNIVKNVLSYLSRKSKLCTSSDPGVKKEKKNKVKGKDLELIHMSRASMYSSSVSDYRNLQGGKFAKDSRISF